MFKKDRKNHAEGAFEKQKYYKIRQDRIPDIGKLLYNGGPTAKFIFAKKIFFLISAF